MLKVYLDNCSLQRPLDTRTQPRIRLEAEAMLAVMDLCDSNELEMISSEVLIYEIRRTPNPTRREYAMELAGKSKTHVLTSYSIVENAGTYIARGIKPLDALHLASAVDAGADFFCTCDDRLLSKARQVDTSTTTVVSPLELITEVQT